MGTRRRITMSLPPALLKRAEQVAREESRTESELLREALRFHVDTRDVRRAAMRDRVIALMDQVQHRTRGRRPGDIRRSVRIEDGKLVA